MKKAILALVFIMTSLFVFGQKASDNFAGKWKTAEGAMVEVLQSGSIFTGTVVENKKVVLRDLKFADGKWTATLIKPKDGSELPCTVTLEGKTMAIVVKKGIASKTIAWTKS